MQLHPFPIKYVKNPKVYRYKKINNRGGRGLDLKEFFY